MPELDKSHIKAQWAWLKKIQPCVWYWINTGTTYKHCNSIFEISNSKIFILERCGNFLAQKQQSNIILRKIIHAKAKKMILNGLGGLDLWKYEQSWSSIIILIYKIKTFSSRTLLPKKFLLTIFCWKYICNL